MAWLMWRTWGRGAGPCTGFKDATISVSVSSIIQFRAGAELLTLFCVPWQNSVFTMLDTSLLDPRLVYLNISEYWRKDSDIVLILLTVPTSVRASALLPSKTSGKERALM